MIGLVGRATAIRELVVALGHFEILLIVLLLANLDDMPLTFTFPIAREHELLVVYDTNFATQPKPQLRQ